MRGDKGILIDTGSLPELRWPRRADTRLHLATLFLPLPSVFPGHIIWAEANCQARTTKESDRDDTLSQAYTGPANRQIPCLSNQIGVQKATGPATKAKAQSTGSRNQFRWTRRSKLTTPATDENPARRRNKHSALKKGLTLSVAQFRGQADSLFQETLGRESLSSNSFRKQTPPRVAVWQGKHAGPAGNAATKAR